MNMFTKTSFWERVNHTVQLFGTGGQVALIANHANPVWNYITGGATVVMMFLSIWFDDKNKDGTVDLFEKTITATVKTSDPEAKVEVSTDVVKKPE